MSAMDTAGSLKLARPFLAGLAARRARGRLRRPALRA